MNQIGKRVLFLLLFAVTFVGVVVYGGFLSQTDPIATTAASGCELTNGSGSISGIVVDENHNPVQAAVFIKDTENNTVKHTETTSDGKYTLSVISGKYVVSADAPGYEPGSSGTICVRRNRTRTANVVIQEQTGGSITLNAVGEDGTSLTGVTVDLWLESDYDDPAQVLRTGQTDSRGDVAFTSLPTGNSSESPIKYIARAGADDDSLASTTTAVELYEPTQTSDSSTMVLQRNSPPQADAGVDRTVASGESIELDGTGSTDPEGDTLSYDWNGTRHLSETDSPTPTFDAPSVDSTTTYIARLVVDDGHGNRDTDTVEITVEPSTLQANDIDGDGAYEDVDGDGSFTVFDASALDSNLDADWVQDNVEKFDFNSDGAVNSADVCKLRREAGGECQPTFEIVSFDTSGSIQRGESIEVSATVENTGDGDGTGNITYAIGGTAVSSQTISLASGDSGTVSFTVSPDGFEPGGYQQSVLTDDDTRRTALTVTSAATPTATETKTNGDTTTPPGDRATSDSGALSLDRTTTSASDGVPLGPLGAGIAVVLLVVSGVTASRLRRDGSGGESSRSSSSEDGRNTDIQTAQSETSDEGATDNSLGGQASTGRPDRSAVPETLTYDDFERGERIGSGGNADVYRATVVGTEGPAEIALKEPRIEGTISTAEVERLLSEAETWAKLDDHEHIVAVYDWDSEPLPWIAMEYLDGGNLATAPPLTYDRSVDVLESVASAIEYAHRAGVAHGDLKPSNVLFAGDPETGVPKVGDWGLAKILLEHSQSTDGLSPAYAAPEQFQGGSQDIVGPQLTDIYQLGAVAYEVFTGQPPFEGTPFEVMEQVRSEQPTPPTEVDPSLPTAVDELIARSMAKDPSDRYEAMIDFRRALEAL